jgi:predicted nucleic acid-binding protein
VIIISNTSPIINLAAISQLELLNKLYGKIIIPQAVHHEITVKGAGQAGSAEIEKLKWIEVKSTSNQNLVQALKMELDDGESEAIALAVELNATLLLIDERRGRAVANRFGVRHIGILAMFIEAKQKGLIKVVKPLLDDLMSKAGFWLSQKLYDRVLKEAAEQSSA